MTKRNVAICMLLALIAFISFAFSANAQTNKSGSNIIGEVATTFSLTGLPDKIIVEKFADPDMPGIGCHLSSAKTGGLMGAVGLAEDKARFSLACRQIGPITVTPELKKQKEIVAQSTSIFFKANRVVRMYDEGFNTFVYLVYSNKLIDGSPQNSISSVTIMPWGDK